MNRAKPNPDQGQPLVSLVHPDEGEGGGVGYLKKRKKRGRETDKGHVRNRPCRRKTGHRNKETKPQHWRTRKQYTTQVTRLPHRGTCQAECVRSAPLGTHTQGPGINVLLIQSRPFRRRRRRRDWRPKRKATQPGEHRVTGALCA